MVPFKALLRSVKAYLKPFKTSFKLSSDVSLDEKNNFWKVWRTLKPTGRKRFDRHGVLQVYLIFLCYTGFPNRRRDEAILQKGLDLHLRLFLEIWMKN